VLHWHVGQPFGSGMKPVWQDTFGQFVAGHIGQKGGLQEHVPSAPRRHVGGASWPWQSGGLKAGIEPHSARVQGALHLHVGHPLASRTLPYWQ
jgi:hypothetical protein